MRLNCGILFRFVASQETDLTVRSVTTKESISVIETNQTAIFTEKVRPSSTLIVLSISYGTKTYVCS